MHVIKRYCCSESPEDFLSADNQVLILFRSTSTNINSAGFKVSYQFIGNIMKL